MLVKVLDTEAASLWYHADKQIIHHQFHKFTYGKEFQELLLTGMELMKKNNAHKWLSDDRDMPVLRPEDMEWAQNTWFPQTVNAGWKYWAIVQPENVIGQLNLDRLVKWYLAAGITARYFHDPDEAMQWLESQ
ncbi:MAG TPA: hypothetical protein VFV34_24425 [Blastocatellia bacterium]|nr:hypothetical protein [Blastocatellia bacterium]